MQQWRVILAGIPPIFLGIILFEDVKYSVPSIQILGTNKKKSTDHTNCLGVYIQCMGKCFSSNMTLSKKINSLFDFTGI